MRADFLVRGAVAVKRVTGTNPGRGVAPVGKRVNNI